jgi:DNA invertase Pin-like site-specific DNA recombinase
MERPALQQLLTDIQAGRIDVVVVCKVDRLTRSLADFAKIVEIFDAKGVSFVSVTQQFNTTTSMGRPTLNVLLSFAQFEREVTGERIRDKIAASKKKGMWMGGVPPLGYGARDRKLVVIEREAETVRHIFGRYSALGSVRLLQEELQAQGLTSKCWTSASGRLWGGKPFARGALYLMLQNRIYRGEIVHKEQSYPGEHTPIIDQERWDMVQARLAANAANAAGHGSGEKAKNPSLLAGIVFAGDGHRMTPSHAVKKGVRYRCYVSHPLITGTRTDAPAARRVPATEIEQIVTSRIRRWLSQPADILAAIASQVTDATDQRHLIDRAAALAGSWSELAPARQRAALAALIERVDIAVDRVDIQLLPTRLVAMLGEAIGEKLPIYDGRTDEPALVLSVPARVRRPDGG